MIKSIPNICYTKSNESKKTLISNDFALRSNCHLFITLYNPNLYQGKITLNINELGDKTIYINDNVSSSSNYQLPAGSYIVYYNGTNFYFNTDGTIPNVSGGGSGASTWSEISGKPFNTVDTNTLKVTNGLLSVNTTNDAEEDNTRPITSAGVNTIVGNINSLLQQI